MLTLERKEEIKDILTEKFIQIRASHLVEEVDGMSEDQIARSTKYAELNVMDLALNQAKQYIEISTEKDHPYPAAKHVHFYIVDAKSVQELVSYIKDIFRND